jgi:S1-C subfamily serine protease
MKIFAQRTSLPFDNRGDGNNPSISPTTQKSVMPFNNVPTIEDLMNGNIKLRDFNPSSGGNWGVGEDTEKNYRETGDDYKRTVRDADILNSMMQPRAKDPQTWKVKVPGGSKSFSSFDMATRYIREKNLPLSYISRIAQNNQNQQEQNKLAIIADSLNKTFMVESLDLVKGVRETGSAFCVAKNYFFTCAHVLKSYNKNSKVKNDYFSNAKISLIQGDRKVEAHIINVDSALDAAIIRCNIDAEPLGIDTDIVVGNDIIAIGSPHGFENNVSTGTVGSLNRKVYFYKGAPEYMFVDLSVFSGNSGGPVIKSDNGKVIGMVTLIVASSGGHGLNAALPSSYILNFCKVNNIITV